MDGEYLKKLTAIKSLIEIEETSNDKVKYNNVKTNIKLKKLYAKTKTKTFLKEFFRVSKFGLTVKLRKIFHTTLITSRYKCSST